MKKILIDFRLANSSHRGMAKYTKECVLEILKLDKNNFFYLIVDREIKSDIETFQNCKIITINCSNYLYFEQIIMPTLIQKLKIDICWFPYNTFPIIKPKNVKYYVTIHDMIFWRLRDYKTFYTFLGNLYRKLILKFFKKNIDKCFTVSKYSQKQIIQKINIDSIVTYNRVKPEKTILFDDNILKNLNLFAQDYYFTISGEGKNKNSIFLIESFIKCNSKRKLVISGFKNPEKSEAYALVKKYKKNDKILFTKHVNENELNSLYGNCFAFIFVSTEEGFGLPIIEAMQHNLNLIVSNVCSIPEIVLDKAYLINPYIQEDFIQIIKKIDQEEKKYILRKEILKYFSGWDKSAKIILEVIENEDISAYA